MPDKLLKDGLRTSEKIGGVSEFAELLFVRLIVATCHAGRCPWNPDWIRSHALPNRRRKRLTEIAAALETLRRAHLVARYTGPDGTAYLLIPNHGQRLSYRVRSPWPAPPDGPPDAEGQTFFGLSLSNGMALPGSPPPAEEKKIKPGGGVPPLFSSTSSGLAAPAARETEAEWLARLAREWPEVDLAAELAEARRKKGRRLERRWFEQHWLPGCSEKVGGSALRSPPSALSSLPPAPADWRARLEKLYPGNAINRDARPWTDVPPDIARRLAEEEAA